MPTFNKLKSEATCLFCKKNKVELKKWNKPCDECKKNGVAKTVKKETEVHIGSRTPAAVLTDKHGREVFVDKNGKVTDNPGYDFKKDPNGWKYAGKVKNKNII